MHFCCFFLEPFHSVTTMVHGPTTTVGSKKSGKYTTSRFESDVLIPSRDSHLHAFLNLFLSSHIFQANLSSVKGAPSDFQKAINIFFLLATSLIEVVVVAGHG